MPVVQVSQAPDRAAYESVMQHLTLDPKPDGLIFHSASETKAGTVEIVDIYESAAQLRAFAQSQLFPAFEAAGVLAMVQAQEPPAAYEPFALVR